MINKERQWDAVLTALGLPEHSDAGDVIFAINQWVKAKGTSATAQQDVNRARRHLLANLVVELEAAGCQLAADIVNGQLARMQGNE